MNNTWESVRSSSKTEEMCKVADLNVGDRIWYSQCWWTVRVITDGGIYANLRDGGQTDRILEVRQDLNVCRFLVAS